MRRALKINFGGPGGVSVDWGSEVDGAPAVAQRAAVSVMTREGSDKALPSRGTGVVSTLFQYGSFDLVGIQHILNFGGLKAREDMRAFGGPSRPASDSVDSIRLTLLGIQDNIAQVGIAATTLDGQSSTEITSIP